MKEAEEKMRKEKYEINLGTRTDITKFWSVNP